MVKTRCVSSNLVSSQASPSTSRARLQGSSGADAFGTHTLPTLPLHGDINLVELAVFCGETFNFVNRLHEACKANDNISGFYADKEAPTAGNKRIFYLQNLCLTGSDFEKIVWESPSTYEGSPNQIVCHLYQPSQPRADLLPIDLCNFLENMDPVVQDAKVFWLKQYNALMHSCIHTYHQGEVHNNCNVGKRSDIRYLVEGDIAATWLDIIATVGKRDPSILVVEVTNLSSSSTTLAPKENVLIGVEIPACETQSFRNRVLGRIYRECNATKSDLSLPTQTVKDAIKRLREQTGFQDDK